MNQNYKILVVDDTPELLNIAVRIIQKAGYIVFSAADGAECMQVLHQEKPDLILLDVMLPDSNGKDLATQIKGDPEFSNVFIILLSSLKISSENVAEGLEDGADGYIIRPVENRELLARISAACRVINSERKLKAASDKYQSLFSAMQEGVYLHQIVYNEQGKAINYRIIEANPVSEIHLNIKPADAIGKLATKLYGTEDAPFLELYGEVADTGKAIAFEQYFPPMGKYFHISVYSPAKGMFATTFSDITERKQAEVKIKRKNEELSKTNAEKDKFFSIIAHDLRSPFSSFLGLTQIMAEELTSLTIVQIQDLAVRLKNSATNLYNLLENLLKWSQAKQGSIPFAPKTIQLKPLVDECLITLIEPAKIKGIALSYTIPENSEVFADSDMLQTIIRNVVSNALKYTSCGGRISFSANLIDKKCVEFSIHDTGIGMSQAMLENLFLPDVQTSRKGTQGEPSTGLGLLLCKEFVEKHDGKIWVESEEEKGSTIYFTLPYKTELEAETIGQQV